MFDFLSIDFETANYRQDPCAVGIALFKNGNVAWEEYTLLNPKSRFDQACVNVHGITSKDVLNAPLFPVFFEKLQPLIKHYPVVAHGAQVERSVLAKSCERFGLDMPKTSFYCTSRLYQYNYKDLGHYTLDFLCSHCGIELEHHNALSDALGCGQLMLRLLDDESTSIFPLDSSRESSSAGYFAQSYPKTPVNVLSNYIMPDVSFDSCQIEICGNTFVITGDIDGYSREEICKEIEAKGGSVKSAPSRKTNYVAVGLLDPDVVSDKVTHKSGKILKAEACRDAGCGLKIVRLTQLIDVLFQQPK